MRGFHLEPEALSGSGHPVAAVRQRTVRIRLEPSPESPSSARRFVRRSLAQMPPEVAATAELLTSELVTNAAIHTRSPIEVEVDLDLSLDSLRISVTDQSERLPEAGQAGHNDEHGRGLAIVDALAQAWGTTKRSTGKTVWITLRLPSIDTVPGVERMEPGDR